MKGRIIVFFVALIMVALPGLGNAQNKQEDTVTLKEVVVTATKTEEKRSDVPNSIVIMDEVDIQESSAQSLGELLANELGIDWRTQGNYGGAAEAIDIRGMSGNATKVLVNGVDIKSPSLGLADVGRIPLNNIQRIEVVKGSDSVLYGSGAMGGTVNIITKAPKRDKIDLEVAGGYGSQGTSYLSAEQGMFLKDDFGYYLTATRRETDGFRDNGDLDHNDVSLKLVLDKGRLWGISLYGDYIDREFGRPGVKPPEGTQDYVNSGLKVYNSDSASLLDRGSDEDAHLVFQFRSMPLEWLDFKLRGDYTTMENYNYTRYVDFFGNLPGSKSWTTNEVKGVEGTVDMELFKGTSMLLGADYKDYEWENKGVNLDTTGAEVSGTESVAVADLHTNGIFAEAQYRPCDYFKATAGVRHEDHSTFGNEVLPRFGAIVTPWGNTVFKVSHGKHFRAPTPNDLFWPDDGFTRGNPNLKPETGWHTDCTIEQGLVHDTIFITASYFHWDVDNKIQWEPDSNGVFTPQNLRSYEADGAELGMRVGPVYNMTISLSYTYTDAEEESRAYTKQDYGFPPLIPPDFQYSWVKRRAIYTPEHQFKGHLTYWTGFGLTSIATVRYVSDRISYRTETDVAYPATKTVTYTLDSYWTVDVKLEQRLYNHWLLSLQGNNLFDKEYDTYLDSFQDQGTGKTTVEGFPGAGRSVFLRVTYEY